MGFPSSIRLFPDQVYVKSPVPPVEAAASEALNMIKQPPTTQPEGDEKQNAAALGLSAAPQYTAG